MIVVATSDGVEEYKGEEKQPIYDLSEFNDDIDPEMKEFISMHKLNDIQQPLLQSKFTVKHLAGLNSRDDGDAYFDDICDREWHLRPTQKYRLKYAIAALNSEPRQLIKKIMIIGDTGVGKSQILRALVGDSFQSGSDACSTIGVDMNTLTMHINEKVQIKFMIWDTAGQERFKDLSQAYYRGAEAVFVVYDVTRKYTLDHVSIWLQEVEKFSTGSVKVLLVGNKTDLRGNREVTVDIATRFAIKQGIPLLETSAKTRNNVDVLKKWMMESLDISFEDKGIIRLDSKEKDSAVKKKRSCC